MADTLTVQQLQEQVTDMKRKLLEWERGFAERHNHKPTIEDVQNRPHVEKYYLKYNKIKRKLKEAQATQPSPRRVEFVHSPSHPRSPHNRLLRTQKQQQQVQQQRMAVKEYRPRPLVFPTDEKIKNAILSKSKIRKQDSTEEEEEDVPEEIRNEAFWLDVSVKELQRLKGTDLDSQQTLEDDNDDLRSQRKRQDGNGGADGQDPAETLDDLFNDQPGNENWVNDEGLGPLAAYTRQKHKSSASNNNKKRKLLQDEQLKEGRRKMRAMLDGYMPRNYDTLTPALAAERQAKRNRENEQQDDNKPLQLAAATTRLDETDSDFIVSRRTYAPLVQSRDTGLLRNNPERRARLLEQLEAGTLGMPKSKPTSPTGDDGTVSTATITTTTTDAAITAIITSPTTTVATELAEEENSVIATTAATLN
ncbi:hypothetical protein BDB00DRAFT_868270 [Zychaea mexicana]|uniref:uncharacterized protein n=1 Tax=Zychaea mexicana TaxID=64656 RepID=UPI0022FF0508|nr:uncharacterized protein BDB00DRAFT_868270 [Zychaea mexicana]KAI9497670.1 hypothetical protein BDB00DRAFT_868270 [Zychaea mexicana]